MPRPEWFARTILPVRDVAASLRFFVDRLGFTSPWSFDEDGKPFVAQVDRDGCSLILSKSWPGKVGQTVVFISLNTDPPTAAAGTAALNALRADLEANGVTVKDGEWGYRLLVVDDPDGNQLLFNYPNEEPAGP
ncbi:MAG TPA: VOC family protein [Gemmatimonadales bacterium]|jgi:catechol 2,3-dioxygenase-like lactoylglutathione lyase family enzyme